jgi:predicted ATPase/DNA-binding SARP family transcriptional activator
MRFLVLGPLQVEENGEAISLGGQRKCAVLALLLINAGRPVSIDRIVSEIWPEEPVAAVRDSLYTYVSQLRKSLGNDRIGRVDGGYRLDLADTDEIDAVGFESAAKQAGRLLGSDPEAASHLLDSALSLWRGRPYEGFEDLSSLVSEATRLEELRLDAVEDRIEAELLAGGTPSAGDVEKLCEEHPYRERLWGLLARTLYRADRQADAVRTFTRVRTILGDELGLGLSPELGRLEERILLQDPSLDPDAAPPPTNLPIPVSSFVGRVDEMALLDKAIHEHRLVTVVGPGGAGKTRLAIEAAGNVRGSFRDGVWTVDLAQVPDPESAPQAVAAALHIAEQPGIDLADSIGAYLRRRTTLLVLDNCEHVVDAVAALATSLLETAPNLKILATSRRVLGSDGEIRFPLEGLATSAQDQPFFDAERLFEARAAAVRVDFGLEGANRSAVDSICRHLDGMPLAIELAAARVDVLSPAEIDGQLSSRFAMLSDQPGQRSVHRSLRASMDWSYDMLPPAGQRAFDSFGVFEGPFFAEAAASGLDGLSDVEIIRQIRALVGASLVQVVASLQGASRYRLLETPRLYARDHLVGSARWDAAVERHDDHYRDVCATLRPAFFGSERVAAQQQIEAELADYHVAFDRMLDNGDINECLEMAWALGHVWLFSSRLVEGERRLVALLEASQGDRDRLRADTLTVASFLTLYRQQFEQAGVWADEAVDIYRAIGDDQGLAYLLARRGHVTFLGGDAPAGAAMLEESLEVCRRIGYDDGTAWPMTLLAQARLWSGDEGPEMRAMAEEGRERFIAMGEIYGQAHADMILGMPHTDDLEYRLRYAEEMVRLSERPGADRLMQTNALHGLAYAIWDAGDFDRAEALNRAAGRASLETGDTVNSGLALLQGATFAGRRGDAVRAAALFGAGDAHLVMQKAPFMSRDYDRTAAAAIATLGEDRYDQLYDEGSRMTLDEATELLVDR